MAPPRPRGFTLVELLIALAILALLSLMSWRAIDAMSRSLQHTQSHGDEVLALQMSLAQWSADLDAALVLPGVPGLDWNGQVLRLARRDVNAPDTPVQVVAWTRRNVDGRGLWLRWQSPALYRQQELQEAWQQATLWAQNPNDSLRQREVRLLPLADWQLFYYRDNSWTHPLSSSGVNNPAVTPGDNTPDGVRLILELPPGSALAGRITRDWVRPSLGGNKS